MRIVRFALHLGMLVSAGWAQSQNVAAVATIEGEISGQQGLLRNDLLVELQGTGSSLPALRTQVASDGTFRFHQVEPGTYRAVVRTESGQILQQKFLTLGPDLAPVVIELQPRKEERPPSGRVSVAELLHPVPKQAPKKAIKAVVRAWRLSVAGQHQKAVNELEMALQIAPDYASAHNDLAIQYLILGRSQEALEHFQTATRIAPGMQVAYRNLAWVLCGFGRYAEAEQAARSALAIDATDGRAHFVLGELLAKLGRREDAVRELKVATASVPIALLRLAQLYSLSGQVAEAQEALRRYQRRYQQGVRNTEPR